MPVREHELHFAQGIVGAGLLPYTDTAAVIPPIHVPAGDSLAAIVEHFIATLLKIAGILLYAAQILALDDGLRNPPIRIELHPFHFIGEEVGLVGRLADNDAG